MLNVAVLTVLSCIFGMVRGLISDPRYIMLDQKPRRHEMITYFDTESAVSSLLAHSLCVQANLFADRKSLLLTRQDRWWKAKKSWIFVTSYLCVLNSKQMSPLDFM